MLQIAVPLRRVGWSEAIAALPRTVLATIVLGLATLSQPSPRDDVQAGLADVSRPVAFSIVGWEAATLADKATLAVESRLNPLPFDETARVALVRAHFATAADIRRLRTRRDDLFAAPQVDRAQLDSVERDLAARESELDAGRARAEEVVSAQVDSVMRDLGLRSSLFSFGRGGWPLAFVRITPEVFFTYQRLPLNLLIAPRDRIAITGSVLVSPALDSARIETLETRVDRLGVSSLVSGIGGFGSYPSMIPDADTLRPSLVTVAHEWTHHYLAFEPLGRAFFSSYDMRTVNETVADIVGEEVGRLTYDRYYATTDRSAPAPHLASAQPPSPSSVAGSTADLRPPRPDFGAEMRRIRAEVEHRLAAQDVSGAEQYMREQRAELARLGFRVRKLNTAYLSFFGAYAGGANRFEAPLRALRRESPSLAAFLQRVARFTTATEVRTAQ